MSCAVDGGIEALWQSAVPYPSSTLPKSDRRSWLCHGLHSALPEARRCSSCLQTTWPVGLLGGILNA